MAYKTPGVYVEEITTFPPSVVPVETAIPAFVGYTEKAIDADEKSLTMVPKRIKSLLEFETYFGGDYRPTSYQVQIRNPGTDNAIGTVTPQPRRYYLYGCLRHFYANGGGSCYVVSAGSYKSSPTKAELQDGLSRLERFDEPTLLVSPDSISLDSSDLGALQVAALEQCDKLQDRFVIMDLHQGNLAPSISVDPVATFRESVGTNNLKYGAAYYPWLQTIYRPEIHFRHLSFVDASDGSIPSNTLDTLIGGAHPTAEETITNALVPTTRNADANVQTVINAVNIGTMAGSDALTLNRDNFAGLTEHFITLVGFLRQVSPPASPADVTAFEAAVRERFGNLLLLTRALSRALPALDTTSGLPSEMNQAIAGLQRDTNLRAVILNLIALEKNENVRRAVASDRTEGDVDTVYSVLNNTVWIAPDANVTVDTINASATPNAGADLRLTALNAAAALQTSFDTIAAAVLSLFETAEFLADEAEKQLFAKHPVMKAAKEQVQKVMGTLPASGAIAGVYAAVDRTRGVWKAPANVSLADVVGPAVKLNEADQADLNVHTTGKSINAIRAFTGKGTLVWGARTLAGNDNEWRYVPVRRFFNMAEESIKKATEPFVFEPNDANTWVRVRAMIENFLTIQWRAGALAGAKPEQAFYVKVGLGETMTAQDILEGRMIVEIGMAVVRPAEFIILKFAHKMQVS